MPAACLFRGLSAIRGASGAHSRINVAGVLLPYGQGPVCSPQPYVLPVEAAGPVYGYDVGAVYPYELRWGQHLHHGFHVCARKHVFAGRPYDFYIIAQGFDVKDVAEGYVNVRVFLLYGDVARLVAAVGEAPYGLVYCAAEPFVGEGLVQEVYGVEVEPLERVSGMGRGEYDACARGHAPGNVEPAGAAHLYVEEHERRLCAQYLPGARLRLAVCGEADAAPPPAELFYDEQRHGLVVNGYAADVFHCSIILSFVMYVSPSGRASSSKRPG